MATSAQSPSDHARDAARAELRIVAWVAAGFAVAGALLVIMPWLAPPVLSWLGAHLPGLEAAQGAQGGGTSDAAWSQSLLSLTCFLVATQLTCALLATEHRHTWSNRKPHLWPVRAAVIATTSACVLLGSPWGWESFARLLPMTPAGRWSASLILAAVLDLLTGLYAVWAFRAARVATASAPARWEPVSSIDRSPSVPGPSRQPDLLPLRAIGASGGGIRAASFVLGGVQALQDVHRDRLPDDPEPELFAVSGGSYIAAAMALRRRFDDRGDALATTGPHPAANVPWTQSYRIGSPELERLRRHTRYLFEPGWALRDGAISLVVGALVNLAVVAAGLRIVTWSVAQLAITSGLVTADGRTPAPYWLLMMGLVGGLGGFWIILQSMRRGRAEGRLGAHGGITAATYRRLVRQRSWVVAILIAWLVVAFLAPVAAIHLNGLVNADWRVQLGGVGGLFTVVTTMLVGFTQQSGTSTSTGRIRTFLRRVATYLPLVIMGGIAAYLVLSWTYATMTRSGQHFPLVNAVIVVLGGVLGYFVDANGTSMHSYYRERLSSAFAVGVSPDGASADEMPFDKVYSFSGLVPSDPSHHTPRLRIVSTLNSSTPGEAPSMRGGFPFVFGPEQALLYRESLRRVEVPSAAYEQFAGPSRSSIMAAVAISGAAVSPLMGRFATRMAPYRMLMALFNVRIGVWLRNPAHVDPNRQDAPGGRGSLWLTSRPGLAQVFTEAVGRASADQRWIYVSDGGHLDNTGLVECVRHCVLHGQGGRIVVLDASNDPVGSWQAVGDAVSVIGSDLGVDLRRDPLHGGSHTSPAGDDPPPAADGAAETGDQLPGAPPPWQLTLAGCLPDGQPLEVLVVKSLRVEPPQDNQPSWYDRLPPNVASFQFTSPSFPRASTLRQKFGDLEFEAYRSLGYAATAASLSYLQWPGPPVCDPGADPAETS